METTVVIEVLEQDSWERLREIRLASLEQNPEAFGAKLSSETQYLENHWRERMDRNTFCVASVAGKDVGVMFVEEAPGDFGVTCWLSGCWVSQEYRGQGVMRAFIDFMDSQKGLRNWSTHGLGVWTDNHEAKAAYERLGFISMGDPQPSTRQSGKFYQRMVRTSPAK
jgi:GNAT superfamily N-acetyltransferase